MEATIDALGRIVTSESGALVATSATEIDNDTVFALLDAGR
jgi:hypothetical protein